MIKEMKTIQQQSVLLIMEDLFMYLLMDDCIKTQFGVQGFLMGQP